MNCTKCKNGFKFSNRMLIYSNCDVKDGIIIGGKIGMYKCKYQYKQALSVKKTNFKTNIQRLITGDDYPSSWSF